MSPGDGRVQLPPMGGEIVGWFRLHQRGFGFVEPEQPYREGDLFVPRGNSRDAISGDRVRATVVRQAWRAKAHPGRSDVVGRIAEVLERGQEQFVGVLVKRGRNWLVEPDGRSLHDPVLIRDPGAKNAKAVPIFRRVFAREPIWSDLVPRLVPSGLLPDKPELISSILDQSP